MLFHETEKQAKRAVILKNVSLVSHSRNGEIWNILNNCGKIKMLWVTSHYWTRVFDQRFASVMHPGFSRNMRN
jgi:hypothetical protein